jgi:hypothetical protein
MLHNNQRAQTQQSMQKVCKILRNNLYAIRRKRFCLAVVLGVQKAAAS